MNDHEPGAFHKLAGRAFYDGEYVADVRIVDERVERHIEVPMPGGTSGVKPVGVSGLLGLEILSVSNGAFGERIENLRRRQRGEHLVARIELENGTVLDQCHIGGHFGENLFGLSIAG